VPKAGGGAVRIGCSGWNYKHWREVFYPKGLPPRRWLDRYASFFDTVEINNTFYRLPRREAVEKWVAETPPGFLFAVKMSRWVTHIRRLNDVPLGLERFYASIEPLASSPKMGPVLWQLPPQFKRNDERLEAALAVLPAGRHCFEFRHESWFAPEVYELLRARDAALVIGDDPRRPFQTLELTAGWTFVRFHAGRHDGDYSEEELEEWARRIEAWRERGDVYAYFNNDWHGFALKDALWLKNRLGVSPVPIPETLRGSPISP
jgi:uncharacterized protein YecE (DUF72 family)